MTTKRQSQILSVLASFTQTKGYPPTYRELMQLLGLSSPSTLHKHIANLKKKGHIQEAPRGWRTLKPTKPVKAHASTKCEIPIIGALSQGQKLELYLQTTSSEIPQSFAAKGSTLYGFKIKDNSLSHLQMLPGDLIIVEARSKLQPKELAIGHSQTGTIHVGHYPEILDEDLRIQGVIVGLLRQY